MTIIKRKIYLENFVSRANNIGLTATTFSIPIFITQSYDNIGLFTDETLISGLTTPNAIDFFNNGNETITAITDSRLIELRSYDNSNPYHINEDQNPEVYLDINDNIVNGVDRLLELTPKQRYVMGVDPADPNFGTSGVTVGMYFEDQGSDQTIVNYRGQGWNQTNTSYSAMTKQEYLFGVVESPEITNDLFIDRGQTTVSDRHTRMSEISSLGDLINYNNGFFNVTRG